MLEIVSKSFDVLNLPRKEVCLLDGVSHDYNVMFF